MQVGYWYNPTIPLQVRCRLATPLGYADYLPNFLGRLLDLCPVESNPILIPLHRTRHLWVRLEVSLQGIDVEMTGRLFAVSGKVHLLAEDGGSS